ncbi:MAG: Fic family protein [Acidobacteriota bacterium]
MEPMMPREGERRLEDLAVELVSKASALAGQVNPVVQQSMSTLVRSMNCYYSNLIEGHDTHPRDIDRALAHNYAKEPTRRALQLEAVAHIEVQTRIDEKKDQGADPMSAEYILWLHREFCQRLPEELLWVEDPETHQKVRVRPGQMRDGNVAVGKHVPPSAGALEKFMGRFEEAYSPRQLSTVRQIISVGAAHHRLLWIHPFYDGNGRVARLMSHGMLQRLGIGSSLWSVARGLARSVNRYKELLMAADEPRRNDLDGRGSLSEAALTNFCEFFLQVCVDQVDFMESLLQPSELLRRIENYVEDEVRAGRLPRGSFVVLREAVLAGQVDRGQARQLTGYQERMGRMILSKLLQKGLLLSNSPKDAVRLGFPIDVVERWFPKLYPTA